MSSTICHGILLTNCGTVVVSDHTGQRSKREKIYSQYVSAANISTRDIDMSLNMGNKLSVEE